MTYMINQMAAILNQPFLIFGSSQNYVYVQENAEIERKKNACQNLVSMVLSNSTNSKRPHPKIS